MLSELIATTKMRKEKVSKKGRKCDQVLTTRVMHDIVAQAQALLEQYKGDLVSAMVVIRILILAASLVFKLGAQYHLGLILIQFLAKNVWDPQDIGDQYDTHEYRVEVDSHMYWLRRLSRNADIE